MQFSRHSKREAALKQLFTDQWGINGVQPQQINRSSACLSTPLLSRVPYSSRATVLFGGKDRAASSLQTKVDISSSAVAIVAILYHTEYFAQWQ